MCLSFRITIDIYPKTKNKTFMQKHVTYLVLRKFTNVWTFHSSSLSKSTSQRMGATQQAHASHLHSLEMKWFPKYYFLGKKTIWKTLQLWTDNITENRINTQLKKFQDTIFKEWSSWGNQHFEMNQYQSFDNKAPESQKQRYL